MQEDPNSIPTIFVMSGLFSKIKILVWINLAKIMCVGGEITNA